MVLISESKSYDADRQLFGALQSNESAEQTRIEYWSKSYQKWIPAQITAVDHDRCAVQVNVKPGVWLASRDLEKKVRVAVYARSAKDKLDVKARNDHDDIENVTSNVDHRSFPPPPSDFEQMIGYDHQDVCSKPELGISPKVTIQLHPSHVSRDVQQEDGADREYRGLHSIYSDRSQVDVLDCGAPLDVTHARAVEFTDDFPAMQMRAASHCEAVQSEERLSFNTSAAIPSKLLESVPPVTFATMQNSSFLQEGTFAGYRCPNCDMGGLESMQAAVDHCSSLGCKIGKPLSCTGIAGLQKEPPVAESLPQSIEIEPLVVESLPKCTETDAPLESYLCKDDNSAGIAGAHAASASSEVDSTESNQEPKEKNEAPQDLLGATYGRAQTRIIGYCCPTCGESMLSSLQEAINHCSNDGQEELDEGDAPGSNTGDAADIAQAPMGLPTEFAPSHTDAYDARAPSTPMILLPGEAVAYNDHGQPIISRQVDPETGNGSTMVLNEDGTCDVFGKQTITSLLSATQDEANDWFGALTDYQLRGLVHELGQRLIQASAVYQSHLKRYEGVSEKTNLEFFGLGPDATDRDLDVAYRQLSKKMHPDKNGGTEESKRRFQEMKTRYEELKKKRGTADDAEKEEKKKDKGKDDESDRTIEFDPNSRTCLNETANKMLTQLSTLDTGLENLLHELRRHGFAV